MICLTCKTEIKCDCGYNCVPCTEISWHVPIVYAKKIVHFCSIICASRIKKCKQCTKIIDKNKTFCNKFCNTLYDIQHGMDHIQMEEDEDNTEEEDCNYDSY